MQLEKLNITKKSFYSLSKILIQQLTEQKKDQIEILN
jgi:hypothetical protein